MTRTYTLVPKYLHPLIRRMAEEDIEYAVIARVIGCSSSRVGQIVRGEQAKLVNGKWTVGKAAEDSHVSPDA